MSSLNIKVIITKMDKLVFFTDFGTEAFNPSRGFREDLPLIAVLNLSYVQLLLSQTCG